ncbi:AsmA-like C-terminal region-containing protein [Xanthovirga aplysinae]|uniref:AsmA-like C-terminal region-containing protein n=1 Tax=Xanthovirga aplysinae TaxID=2529853 RepID=UPI0016572820
MALVFVYQEDIIQKVLKEVNNRIETKIWFKKISVDPLGNFPEVTVSAQEVRVSGGIQEDSLLVSKNIKLTLNLYDLIRRDFQFKRLKLQNGGLYMRVDARGNKNFTIFKENKESKFTRKSLRLFIAKIDFENFGLLYDNQQTNLFCNFQANTFNASLLAIQRRMSVFVKGDLSVHSLSKDHIIFLKDRPLGIDGRIVYNFENKTVRVGKGDLEVDDAKLSLTGSMSLEDYKIYYSLLRTPNINIETLKTLLPSVALKQIKRFDPIGRLKFSITAQRLDTSMILPKIMAEVSTLSSDTLVNSFYDPWIKKEFSNVNLKARFNNGDSLLPQTFSIDVRDIDVELENFRQKGRFLLYNLKDPHLLLDLDLNTDISNILKHFKIPPIEYTKGHINTKFLLKGKTANFFQTLEADSKFKATINGGTLKIKGMDLPFTNVSGDLNIDVKTLQGKNVYFNLDKNRFQLYTNITNWLTLFKKSDRDVLVEMDLRSTEVFFAPLFNKTYPTNEQADLTNFSFEGTLFISNQSIRDKSWIINNMAEFNRLKFTSNKYHLPIEFSGGSISISDKQVEIDELEGKVGNSHFLLNSNISNFIKRKDVSIDTIRIQSSLFAPIIDLTEISGAPYHQDSLERIKHKRMIDLNLKSSIKIPSGIFSADSLLALSRFWVRDLNFQMEGYQPRFHDIQSQINIEKSNVEIRELRGMIGKSDLAVTGNLINAFKKDEKLLIDISFNSNLLDFDELMFDQESLEENEKLIPNQDDQKNKGKRSPRAVKIKLPDLKFMAFVNQIKFKKFSNYKFRGDLSITDNQYVRINTLQTHIAGGTVSLKGDLDLSDRKEMNYKGQVDMQNINLSDFLFSFENFQQDILVDENVGGQVSAIINTEFYFDEKLKPDLSKTEVILDATVKNGRLLNFKPLRIMSIFFQNEALSDIRFYDLSNTLVYKDSVFYIPKMKINSNLGYFFVAGTQTVENLMDYHLEVPIRVLKVIPVKLFKRIPYFITVRLPRKILGKPDIETVSYAEDRFLNTNVYINIKGTPSEFEVTYENRKIASKIANEIFEYYKNELKLNIDRFRNR